MEALSVREYRNNLAASFTKADNGEQVLIRRNTKVDRSGAYMARYIAKNLVAAGLADACQLQLAYAIGVAHPVSVLVETYGTGKIADDKLAQLVRECFDLRPAAIIKTLDLRRPIYRQTAGYGHFGRAELDLPWEKTDMVQTLLAKA